MQKDLFGNDVDDRDSFEKELQEFDEATFGLRLSRFRYFYKYFPQYNSIMFGSDESYRIFHEVKNCFINGEYIAVLILSQSFIERRFQESLKIFGLEKESKDTFNNILKNLAGNGTIPEYFLDKLDALRLKRNPFVHLREVLDKDNLYSRTYSGVYPFTFSGDVRSLFVQKRLGKCNINIFFLNFLRSIENALIYERFCLNRLPQSVHFQ